MVLCRRDTGAKSTVSWADLTTAVPTLLEQIQARATSHFLDSTPCAPTADTRRHLRSCLAVLDHTLWAMHAPVQQGPSWQRKPF